MDWIKTVNNAIEYMEDHLTDRIAIEGGQIMEYRIEKWEAMDSVSDYELIPDVDIENYLPGDPSSRDYVSEICIPVRKRGSTV